MTTFVMIHGAGDVGWYWHLLEPELRQRGHEVLAPDLPCDDDTASLLDYADAVVACIADRRDLIVVGQSYGGFTAALVADRLAVDALVFVAGMVPVPGEKPADWWNNTGYQQAVDEQARCDGGLTGNYDPFVAFYHDVPRALAEQALSKERSESDTAFNSPWPLDALPASRPSSWCAPRIGSSPHRSCAGSPASVSGSVPTRSRRATAWRSAAHTNSPTCSTATPARLSHERGGWHSTRDTRCPFRPSVAAVWRALRPARRDGVAAEAEQAGWHGVFVWDHLCWREPVSQTRDPWITLAAIAAGTGQVRLGQWSRLLPADVRPRSPGRARPLDTLSRGRLTLGVGIGSDRFGRELSKTGEQLDDRLRGHMLDESLEILTSAWSGEPVHHRGEQYTVDGIRFLPRPVQRPDGRVWVAGLRGNLKPLQRAARFDLFFPANLEHPDQLGEVAAALADLRQDDRPYDIAVGLPLGVDPMPYTRAGATWWLPEIAPEAVSLDAVRGGLRDGPLAQ